MVAKIKPKNRPPKNASTDICKLIQAPLIRYGKNSNT
jgi:hypothetical protein